MGYMTVVSILNDAWPLIKENPEQFLKNIEDGMENHNGKAVNMYPVANHANPMEVHISFHNSLNHVLVVGGNHMEDIVELQPSKTRDDFYLAYKMRMAEVAKSQAESIELEIRREFAKMVAEDMRRSGASFDSIKECAEKYKTYSEMDEEGKKNTIFLIGAILTKN